MKDERIALASYLCFCCGLGALFGAKGFPLPFDFFYEPLWLIGVSLFVAGALRLMQDRDWKWKL